MGNNLRLIAFYSLLILALSFTSLLASNEFSILVWQIVTIVGFTIAVLSAVVESRMDKKDYPVPKWNNIKHWSKSMIGMMLGIISWGLGLSLIGLLR